MLDALDAESVRAIVRDELERITVEDDREPDALALPVEPLYSMPVAALLVPCAVETLRKTLRQFPEVFEPPYYTMTSKHTLRRMLTASQVIWLRTRFVRRLKAKRIPTPLHRTDTSIQP